MSFLVAIPWLLSIEEKSPNAIVEFYRMGPELLVCRDGTGIEQGLVEVRRVTRARQPPRETRIGVRPG